MIHRNFNNLKFKRTYIGGSKERELEIFANVQGIKEDNSEVDWFKYRRLLMKYCDDVLHIILSWRYLFNIFRYGFLVLATLLSFINPIFSIPALILGGLALIGFQVLKNRESKKMGEYSFSLDVINEQTGVDLNKNQ